MFLQSHSEFSCQYSKVAMSLMRVKRIQRRQEECIEQRNNGVKNICVTCESGPMPFCVVQRQKNSTLLFQGWH